jgi:hypothetical protein
MYEFGLKSAIENVLEKLRLLAKKQKIKVIVRGQHSRKIAFDQHPWLTEIETAIHFPMASIYSAGSSD